jgi:lipid II:glycine glycyltransferase (peptidoglycan interpeptide bridge formation enzyme)
MNKDLAGPTNANDLLQWRAIQDACASGCRHYHLGESGASRSLARFKEKFTARPVPYTEYVIERAPVSRLDAAARGAVKRAIRFRDV